MSNPIILLGAGGHARVLLDVLLLRNIKVLAVSTAEKEDIRSGLDGSLVIDDDEVFRYSPETVCLVNGVGSVYKTERRQALFRKFKDAGYTFASVIHPAAIISSDISLGEGVQIMAGAVIQPGCKIGCNTIINTRVAVDHDCYVGNHVHIAPGATMSGGVHVGDGAHVGSGATIIQGIRVGENSVVGAGAVVIRDLPACRKAVGVPAREIGVL